MPDPFQSSRAVPAASSPAESRCETSPLPALPSPETAHVWRHWRSPFVATVSLGKADGRLPASLARNPAAWVPPIERAQQRAQPIAQSLSNTIRPTLPAQKTLPAGRAGLEIYALVRSLPPVSLEAAPWQPASRSCRGPILSARRSPLGMGCWNPRASGKQTRVPRSIENASRGLSQDISRSLAQSRQECWAQFRGAEAAARASASGQPPPDCPRGTPVSR